MCKFKYVLLLVVLVISAFGAESVGPLELLPTSSASSQGIFLSDLVNKTEQPLPRIQLAPAPQIGRPIFLTRPQINALLTKAAPDLTCTNWAGADRVKVVRATRVVNEPVLKELLTETLQRDFVKDRGEIGRASCR